MNTLPHRQPPSTCRLLGLGATLFTLLCTTISAQQFPGATRDPDVPSPAQAATSTQLRSAEAALEHGDYATAVSALKKLASSQPRNAQVLYDLGFAQERLGDETAAATAYTESIAADPTLPEPQVALGLLDARSGRLDAAHRELETASTLSNAGNDLRARALRSLAVLDENTNPDASREELLAALKLSPETPGDILLSARLAEHAKDMPDAEAAYRRLLALQPGNVDATVGLAHTLEAQKKTADAESILTAALKTNPSDPRLLAQLASVYGDEGKPQQAIPLIEQLRATGAADAQDPTMTRLLAHLYMLSGDDAKAEPLYRDLVQKEGDPILLDDFASVLVHELKFAEAQTVLVKAVAMRSRFPSQADWAEAAGHLAFAASRNHDPQLTLQALAARATVLPNSPASLFLEATAHDALHQRPEAERAYRAFLAAAAGKYPDQEFQARHRLITLEHER